MKKVLLVSGLAVAALLSGCANKIGVVSNLETDVVRAPVSHYVDIKTDQGASDLVDRFVVAVEVEESKTEKVTTLEKTKKYEEATPYQAWREAYEIPLGLVAIPLGVVTNIVDFALLGLLPNQLSDGVLNAGFAGLNPFLNIESDSRTTRTLLEESERVIDETTDFQKRPWANGSLTVWAGETATELKLDERGSAKLNLVSLEGMTGATSLRLTAQVGENQAEKTLVTSRKIRYTLPKAREIYGFYFSAEKPAFAEVANPVDAIGDAILQLSNMGLEEMSLSLETKAAQWLSEEELSQLHEKLLSPSI